ncbi:MAG: hypothetical protein KA914_02630 [Ottowia sp.]|nr:hypothetical protein [Ottowia sp.]
MFAPDNAAPARFVPIDASRWRRGLPQRSRLAILWWRLTPTLLNLATVSIFLWLQTDRQQWQHVPLLCVALAALLLQLMKDWAVLTSEVWVSSVELHLRYAWPWLDRWLGWRALLIDLQFARCIVSSPHSAQDPLLGVRLVPESRTLRGTSRPWALRQLDLSSWARSAQGHEQSIAMSSWPAPRVPVSHMDVFLGRASRLQDTADLRTRLAQLPLAQALRAHGIDVSALLIEQAIAGQLDLARVPELRKGLWALGLLAVAAVVAWAGLERWHFFVTPGGLYAVVAGALMLPAIWALWPRRAHLRQALQAVRNFGPRPDTPIDEAAPIAPTVQHESMTATVFIGVMCSLLAAWLVVGGMLWAATHAQPATPQRFVLDKSRIVPGPIILRAQANGVPDIHIDSQVSFWKRQQDGLVLVLPVWRLGPWWMYDEAPIRALRE